MRRPRVRRQAPTRRWLWLAFNRSSGADALSNTPQLCRSRVGNGVRPSARARIRSAVLSGLIAAFVAGPAACQVKSNAPSPDVRPDQSMVAVTLGSPGGPEIAVRIPLSFIDRKAPQQDLTKPDASVDSIFLLISRTDENCIARPKCVDFFNASGAEEQRLVLSVSPPDFIERYVARRISGANPVNSFTNAYVFGLRILQTNLRQDDSQLEATNAGQPAVYNQRDNPQWLHDPRPPHVFLYCPRTTPPRGALCRLTFQLRNLFLFEAYIPPTDLDHWWTVPLAFDGLIDIFLEKTR